MKVGNKVKQIRTNLGLTQNEFAKKLGISRSYLGSIESGEKGCSPNFMKALAQHTSVSLDWLMSEDDKLSPKETCDTDELLSALEIIQEQTEKAIYLLNKRKEKDND